MRLLPSEIHRVSLVALLWPDHGWSQHSSHPPNETVLNSSKFPRSRMRLRGMFYPDGSCIFVPFTSRSSSPLPGPSPNLATPSAPPPIWSLDPFPQTNDKQQTTTTTNHQHQQEKRRRRKMKGVQLKISQSWKRVKGRGKQPPILQCFCSHSEE